MEKRDANKQIVIKADSSAWLNKQNAGRFFDVLSEIRNTSISATITADTNKSDRNTEMHEGVQRD